jgi:hypothetical protein
MYRRQRVVCLWTQVHPGCKVARHAASRAWHPLDTRLSCCAIEFVPRNVMTARREGERVQLPTGVCAMLMNGCQCKLERVMISPSGDLELPGSEWRIR